MMYDALEPTAIRSYLKDKGWMQIDAVSSDSIYVLGNIEFPKRQIKIPANLDFADYSEAIRMAVEKIAVIYNKSAVDLIREIRYRNYDSGVFRVGAKFDNLDSLPLEYFARSIDAVRQIVLSSACLAVDPKPYYKRLRRSEAGQVLENTHFNHTERGSFVLRVSCDVSSVEVYDLFDDGHNSSVVRKTFENIYRSSQAIVNAIARDEVEKLIDGQRGDESPILSANYCEALSSMLEEPSDMYLDISCSFSSKLAANFDATAPNRLKREYAPIISDIGRDLRDEESPEADTFIGTVEELHGELDGNGQRSGSVILALLLNDTETVRARATLNARDYEIADKAHMSRLGYVQVEGTLHPGRQPRALKDIRQFRSV